jgi:hypothetical protein
MKEMLVKRKYINKNGEEVEKVYIYNNRKESSQCLVGKTKIDQKAIKEFKGKLSEERKEVFVEMLKDALINKKYLSTNIVELEFKKRGI